MSKPKTSFWGKSLMSVLLCFMLSTCASLPGGETTPVKSLNDTYQYRMLTLENALPVLLISDPDAPKAAAALSVNVGSGDNPPGRGGLAHFLEHMLFLGTDKYPNAAEYEQFITEHGGNRNAYTSFQETNYFFDVNSQHLPEALDRFAQFFIAPRFDAQYVDREKNAVEAEYQMSLKSDGRRGLDVLQEVMNAEHPYSQFSVGSLQTLADRPNSTVRDELLKFYKKHYSANAMRLVVFGAQSLDELEALTTPIFSQIPNRDYEHAAVDAPIFNPETVPLLVQVQPLATRRQLEVFFPIGDYRDLYRENPLSYLGNLLGHEGAGSVLSQLKAEGLAEELGAGPALGWRGGSLFSVSISLTQKGVVEYERVLQLLFLYTEMLRREGPSESLYREQAQLAKLRFRYREPGNPIGYVSSLASGMHSYSAADTLSGPYAMEKYDAPMIGELLTAIRPENAIVMLDDASVHTDMVSNKYQVNYSRAPLNVSRVQAASNDKALGGLHLPAPNEFIAQDVSLVSLDEGLPRIPQVVLETARQKIWSMPDAEFRVPKGVTYINFRTPHTGETPEQTAQATLYAALLMDHVNEFAYPARLAGLGFSFYRHATGMSLRLSGYNDKQSLLLSRLLEQAASVEFDPQRFENIRQDMIRGLKNSVAKRPSSQLMDDLRESLVHGEWGEQRVIDALQKTDLKTLNTYVKKFWRDASAQVLVYGNYKAGTVEEISQKLAKILPDGEAPALGKRKLLKIAAANSLQYAVTIPHDDSVVAWYLQGDGKTWRDRAATGLAAQIMTSGFFQQLRTEQQLGYVVSAFSWTRLEVPGLVMLVQSPVADAPAVTQAMQVFLNAVEESLDEAQFERHKVALVSDILRPDKNLGERAEYYWRSIANKRHDFSSRDDLAAAVEALSMEEWVTYFRRVFIEQPHSLQVVSPGRWQKLPQVDGKRYDSAEAIKSGHEAYPL